MAMSELNFVDDKRRATQRLVDVIQQQCLSTTFRALAKQTGIAVNTVKNIAHDLIEELERTVRYETPMIMVIDEVNLAGGYRCVITNLATNNVFDILEYRTQDHLKAFFKDLSDGDKVEWVCTDIWRTCKHSFAQYLPNPKLVIDKFHVVKMASEALEEEHKKYQVQLSKADRISVKKSPLVDAKAPRQLFSGKAERFFGIYDEPDKYNAQNAFEA